MTGGPPQPVNHFACATGRHKPYNVIYEILVAPQGVGMQSPETATTVRVEAARQ